MKNWILALGLLVSPLSLTATEMQWTQDEQSGLFIDLKTERLEIRTIMPEDLPAFCALFGDPRVMSSFAAGTTRSIEMTTERFNKSWRVRWQTGDPFSAMAVLLPQQEAEPVLIGTVVLGHGEIGGQSELAFLFFPEYWEHGYGKEAVGAVVKTLAAELAKKGYMVGGAPFAEIVATCRTDNIRSTKILQGLGMREVGRAEKYGSERIFFSLAVGEL